MTIEYFDPAPPQTITPGAIYDVPWPYIAGAVRAAVLHDGARVVLSDTDFAVTPASSDTDGTMTLSAGAQALYPGGLLIVLRETPMEQGWQGLQGPRERGLESQLDAIVMRVQELASAVKTTVRVDGVIDPAVKVEGQVLVWGPAGLQPGPSVDDVAGAAEAAAEAEASRQAAVQAAGNAALYEGVWLDSSELVIADAAVTYGPGAGQVQAGDYLRTRRGQHSYKVAPAGGPAAITTPGLLKLSPERMEGRWPLEIMGRGVNGYVDAALLTLLQEAGAAGGGVVVLPDYDVRLGAGVTHSLTGAYLNQPVGIVGVHPRRSRIIVEAGAAKGVEMGSPTARGASYIFKDFSVLAAGYVAGAPLALPMLIGGSRPNISLVMENVECQGLQGAGAVANTTDYFGAGINISGAWRASVSRVICGGALRAAGSDDYTNGSNSYRMSEALRASGCYDLLIDRCRFFDASKGIRAFDPDGGAGAGETPAYVGAEVFRCYRSQIDMVDIGIDYFRPGLEPQFVVSDTYINYRSVGVKVIGARIGQINGCMIDQKDVGNNAPVANPADIQLDVCRDFIVRDNHGNFAGDTRRRQFAVLDTDATAGRTTGGIAILDNAATGVFDAIIFNGANAEALTYRPGDVASATVTAEVVNQSANPVIVQRAASFLAKLRRTAAQSIADNSWTAVQFDAAGLEDIGTIWDVAAPAAITVPPGRGIRWARLTVTAAFASHATGRRGMRVTVAGAEVADGFNLSAAPAPGAETRLNATTEWMAVTASQVINVELYQNSGAALNMNQTRVMAEFR